MSSTSPSTHPGDGAAPAPALPAPASAAAVAAPAVHRRVVAPFWSAPLARRTWQEFEYLLLALVLTPLGFTYATFTVSFTAGIAATVVGLFVAGWLVFGARGWGSLFRGLGSGLLAVDVPAPAPPVRRRGFWRTLGGLLGDVPGWRALAFVSAAFPLALVAPDKPLPLTRQVNPAWAKALADLRATCCKDKDALTEQEWLALSARFEGYTAWLAKRAGGEVEKLGMARAETVKRQLAEQYQVPVEKISVVSYGENKPMAPNSTKEGRAENRRVVIKVG